VAQEPFGRLEAVGEGLWAFISTPLGGDYTTVCNGGIVAGRDGVLVIEAFQTPEGALWMAQKTRELTGRWPSHVLVTHYHGDHSGGAEGFSPPGGAGSNGAGTEGPRLHVTPTTRDLKVASFPENASDVVRRLWADVTLIPEDAPGELDLGGRRVELVPRTGHTPSDVTPDLPEEGITWCGDLVWNGMFPNYMDAIPSRLSTAVRNLRATRRRIYVPGHGPLADSAAMAGYVEVIDGLEATARTARREGWTSEEAGARHRIPEHLGEWTLFNPNYYQRAVEAWMREWESSG
jgi:glyoxylase-like metal-dependent hydrolase (beta-lactamase superfamily II)